MSSLTDLREVVDVVIGVDTHVHTHSAAVVETRTGGVLDEITVEATADGYARPIMPLAARGNPHRCHHRTRFDRASFEVRSRRARDCPPNGVSGLTVRIPFAA